MFGGQLDPLGLGHVCRRGQYIFSPAMTGQATLFLEDYSSLYTAEDSGAGKLHARPETVLPLAAIPAKVSVVSVSLLQPFCLLLPSFVRHPGALGMATFALSWGCSRFLVVKHAQKDIDENHL